MATILKQFQIEAIEQAVETFKETSRMLSAASSPEEKQTIISYNGCMLIEAPTGAGKTLMAGHIAEAMSKCVPVVWFWFAPLKGLTGQAEAVIREEFPKLRVRDIKNDREIKSVKSGDTWIMTWASVAAVVAASRQVRQDTETMPSIDNFIGVLRSEGYRIGVVVDEAHHSFQTATEARNFYQNILDPDFAILATATPNDEDVHKFKKIIGLSEMRRISVSRQDCVDAGIIKRGIRAVAFYPTTQDRLSKVADLEKAAIAHGVNIHKKISNKLQELEISMEPLLLVQVESRDNSIEDAQRMLIENGILKEEIAIHTALEPDPDVLAIAKDEKKKVLIFKMAVAIGFDAPRAFTLVSLRKVRDVDFGLQIVGRILRVDRRLQGKDIPDELQHGYVVLADYDSQTGLLSAAQRINKIVTDMTQATPNTRITIITIGEDTKVQLADTKGRMNLFPDFEKDKTSNVLINFTPVQSDKPYKQSSLFEIQDILPTIGEEQKVPQLPIISALPIQLKGMIETNSNIYTLRPENDIPMLLREEYPWDALEQAVEVIVNHIDLNPEILMAAHRRTVQLKKKDVEIFTGETIVTDAKAMVSMNEVNKIFQTVLFANDYIDPRELHAKLIERLKTEMENLGWVQSDDDQFIREALALIIAQHPKLVANARKQFLASHKVTREAELLPERIVSDGVLETATKNVYGVFPTSLSPEELMFAKYLDSDTSGTVEWWIRNEDRKPWAARVLDPDLPNAYYPDFVVKVKGRKNNSGIILVETKGLHILQYPETIVKSRAVHKEYKRVMMVLKKKDGEWFIVENDESGERNILDRTFRISLLKDY